MINVNDLGEVVRPIWAPIGAIVAESAGWPLGAGKQSRNRGEEVAPVKGRRQALRPPVDLEGAGPLRATPDELEQAVAGADMLPAVGFDYESRPRSADAGIDDAEKDGWLGKPRGKGRQQICRRLRVAGRRVGEQVDDGLARRQVVQNRL